MLFVFTAIVALATTLNRIQIHRTVSPTWYLENGGELRFEKNSHGWPIDIGVPSRASLVTEIGKTANGSPILNWKYYMRYPNPAGIIGNGLVAAAIVIATDLAVVATKRRVNNAMHPSGGSSIPGMDTSTPAAR